MIDWNNFDRNNRDDDEDNKKFTRTEVIDWDNFSKNRNMVNNSSEIIDWDNFGGKGNTPEVKAQRDKALKDFLSKYKEKPNNNVQNIVNTSTDEMKSKTNEQVQTNQNNTQTRQEEEKKRNEKIQQQATMNAITKSQERERNRQNSISSEGNSFQIVDNSAKNKFKKAKEIRSATENNPKTTKTVKLNSQEEISQEDLLKYQNQKRPGTYDSESKKISENFKLGAENTLMQIPYYIENEMTANSKQYARNIEGKYLSSKNVNQLEKQLYVSATKDRLLDNSGNKVSTEDLGLDINLVSRNLENKISENQTRIERNIYSMNNPIDRKLAELSPSLGQMAVVAGLSFIPGYGQVIGGTVFTLSAAGGYVLDAKQRGMNRKEAVRYGTIMGAFESATEQFTLSRLFKGGKFLASNDFVNALKNYGISIADNFIQEAVIEPASEATATAIGGKETANWDNMLSRMWEAGFNGALVAIIMGGADAGVSSAVNIYNDLKDGNSFTKKQLQNAIKDVNDSGLVDVDGIIQDTISGLSDNHNIGVFYTFSFNQDGDLIGMQEYQGKRIANPNENINIDPAIIFNKETNTFNIADATTGILLDSAPYSTLLEAQNGFYNKILNVDDATIKNINDMVNRANIAIENKAIEINFDAENVQNNTETGLENVMDNTQNDSDNVNATYNVNDNIESNINTDAYVSDNTDINASDSNNMQMQDANIQNINTNISQTSQNRYIDDGNPYRANYVSNNSESLRSENNASSKNGLDEVSTLMAQMSDNSVYNREKTNQAFRTVANNIPNIEIEVNNDGTYLNSLDKEGNVAYRQEILNRPYTGGQIKEVVNNAINNADLSNINSTQTSQNGFRDVLNNNTSNYMSDNENANVGQNNEQLQQDIKSFSNQVDAVLSGTFPKNSMLTLLSHTPKPLLDIGLQDLPITMTQRHLDTIMNKTGKYKGANYHDLGIDIVKQLPEAIDNPLDIVESNTNSESIVLSTYLSDKQDRTIIASIRIDGTGRINNIMIDSNVMTSAYGRNNYDKFMQDNINNGRLLYDIDRGVIKKVTRARLQLPRTSNSTTNTNGSISNNSITPISKVVNKPISATTNNSMQNNENNTQNIKKELHNRIQNALLSKNSRKNTFLGTVSNKVVNKIKSLFGIDVSGRKHMISDYDIRHIIKQHGNPIIEKSKGQIAVTTKDIEKIPDIIENYDSIIKGTPNIDTLTKEQFNTIRYTKNYNDNTTYVVEVIPSNNNQLNIKTMWKKPITLTNNQKTPSSTSKTKSNTGSSTKKNNPVGVNHGYHEAKALHYTSETKPNSSYSNKSIPQASQNVKDNGIRAERTSNHLMIKPYNDNDIKRFSTGNNLIDGVTGDLKTFVNQFYDTLTKKAKKKNGAKTKETKMFIGRINDSLSNKLNNIINNSNRFEKSFDTTDTNIVISSNNIEHIYNQHGNENRIGQIDVNPERLSKYGEVISNPDYIGLSSQLSRGNTPTLYFTKKINGYSVAVEVLSSRKQLYPETYYVFKSDSQEYRDFINNNDLIKIETEDVESNGTQPHDINVQDDTSVVSSKSIPQANENVKDNGIRAERTSNKIEYDNQGNRLAKTQSDFFKDSKVRDENGKLLVMYHGTDKTFYEFKNKKAQHGRAIIDGYYLTPNRNVANEYGSNVMEVYVNIKNPLYLHNNNGLTRELINRGYANTTSELIEKYGLETDNSGVVPTSKALTKLVKGLGYDGIITTTLDVDNIDTSYEYTQIVALKSNQIKNVTNTTPTSNPDIRYENRGNIASQPYDARRYEKNNDFMKYLKQNNYLKELMKLDEKRGETFAHSADRLIEQEIRKLENTNGFDNNIPVTKLTNIDESIENYLGKTIGKGHFRERARGIYNKNTDRISVKEYKDLDNVFHELGHALDLGGRINVDKASLSDELLAATKRHGGYEEESIGVQLDEGFAEILKTYAINKDIVKQDYPKSYKILEDFKNNDKSFGNFITKLQQDTYNYIHQSPRNREFGNQSIGERTHKTNLDINSMTKKVVKTVWDSNYELKSMVNEFAKATGKKPNASQNAYLLTRLASGVDNKIVSMLSNGYVDLDGIRLMPGLNRIGEILGNNPERINDLRVYLAARRDLEYKRDNLKTGLRTSDSKAIIEQFYNDTQIQEAAQVVYDTIDGVLQYAVNNGIISEETATELRKNNVFYVPFQRVIEGRGNQVGKRGAVADVLKTRTGSELDIKDILENVVANSANIIRQVENNNVLKAIYEQGEETGMKNNVFQEVPPPMKKIGTELLSTWESELQNQGIDTSNLELDKTLDIFVPNNNIVTEHDGSHIVSFFDKNGKRKYLQFYKESTDIFNSLMGLDGKIMSQVLRLNKTFNMPLRMGATMANVGFAIPNMISDTVQATIFSEAGFVPVVDNVIGVLDVLGATNKTVRNFLNKHAPEYAKRINKMYDIYEQTGASSSTRMSQYDRKSTQDVMSDIYGTKNSETLGIKEKYKPLKRLLDILTYIPELSEQSTRFRVFERNYNAYSEKGMSETDARIQAAIESRDATQDFGRTGNLTREINQLIPFSAARVGSAYTFAEKIKANPKRVATRIAILSVVTMAIKALGYDDDEIEELNQRKKDDNFVIKLGNTVFTIKKPQGILRSIVNLVEYVQDLATGHIEEGKEGQRLAEWLNNAIMDNMPADSVTGLVPNMIAPVVENAINKDFYYNTDIVKSYDLDLPDEQQYYDYTSQVAIWLGQIFNYPPAYIDNLISGYLGGLGTQLTNIIDWTTGILGISAQEPAMGAEDNAIGKRFVVNVNENSASVDEIYSTRDELTKKLNGGTITEKENAKLESVKDGISKISALNKQIKAIKQDLTMSGKEKADAIRPLQEQKTDVARQALGKEPIYTENTDELNSIEFYPSRSSISYNGVTLEMDEDMKKEYEDLAYNMFKKYEKQGVYSETYLETLKSKCKDYAKKAIMQKYRSKLVRSK